MTNSQPEQSNARPERDTDQTPDERPETAARDRSDVIGAGAPGTGQIKDPEDWVTGDEPMTDAQRGYLDNLAKQAGETLPADLTKAQASEHIDRLQSLAGRADQSEQAQQDQLPGTEPSR